MARHGETDWNRESRFQGHADTTLNEAGRGQARALAERLADERIAAVYASPLLRACETAEIVAARLGLAVETVEGLREVDVGSWSGLTRAEVEERFPEGSAGGSRSTTAGRTARATRSSGGACSASLRSSPRSHPGERVLVVSHGGPMRAAMAAAAEVAYADARRGAKPVGNCDVADLPLRGRAAASTRRLGSGCVQRWPFGSTLRRGELVQRHVSALDDDDVRIHVH